MCAHLLTISYRVIPNLECFRGRPNLHLSNGTRDAHLRWHKLSLDLPSIGREPYRIIVVDHHASTAEAVRKFAPTTGYQVYIAPDIPHVRGVAVALVLDALLSD